MIEADIKTVLKHNKFARGRHTRRVPGTMNKTEERYNAYLELQRRAGLIAWYKFEALTFKLASDTRYTPDFVVMLPDGMLEAHEVKGRTKDKRTGEYKAYSMEDSLIKIKVASEQFPVQFVRTFEGTDGGWVREEF